MRQTLVTRDDVVALIRDVKRRQAVFETLSVRSSEKKESRFVTLSSGGWSNEMVFRPASRRVSVQISVSDNMVGNVMSGPGGVYSDMRYRVWAKVVRSGGGVAWQSLTTPPGVSQFSLSLPDQSGLDDNERARGTFKLQCYSDLERRFSVQVIAL